MRRAVCVAVLLGLPIVLSGCFVSRTNRPAVYGIDLRLSPGVPVGDRATVHATGAYARSIVGAGVSTCAPIIIL